MKKTFAVILASMMLIFAFAGCGDKAEPSTAPATESTEVSEAPEAETSTEATESEAPETEAAESEAPADASASPAA
ncbi:MAG: hypothetical protein ACOX66_06435 [Oscillospiraceae bacterium]|jgi:predicted small lipoprotein YifL